MKLPGRNLEKARLNREHLEKFRTIHNPLYNALESVFGMVSVERFSSSSGKRLTVKSNKLISESANFTIYHKSLNIDMCRTKDSQSGCFVYTTALEFEEELSSFKSWNDVWGGDRPLSQ